MGDAIFLPSGRLHALGAGLLIVEIQQNSDTTYRVFDWDRVGDDGQPRALHLEESLRSINFADFEPQKVQPAGERLLRRRGFTVEKWLLPKPRRALECPAAALFVCLQGAARLGPTELAAGDFFLVPAGCGRAELEPRAEHTELLRVTLPTR